MIENKLLLLLDHLALKLNYKSEAPDLFYTTALTAIVIYLNIFKIFYRRNRRR